MYWAVIFWGPSRFHCVFYYRPNVTLKAIHCSLELNTCSVQNSNTQLNSIFHDLHPLLSQCLRERMEALTYIAFLIIDGDEAYAGIIGDVLCSPGDINPCAGFVKQSQSIAGGVAHRFQLLLLTVINYCGGGKKKDNPSSLGTLNTRMLPLSWLFLPENDQTAETKEFNIKSPVLYYFFWDTSSWSFNGALCRVCPSHTTLPHLLTVYLPVLLQLPLAQNYNDWRLFSQPFLKWCINGIKRFGLPLAHQLNDRMTLQKPNWLHRSTKRTGGHLNPWGK